MLFTALMLPTQTSLISLIPNQYLIPVDQSRYAERRLRTKSRAFKMLTEQNEQGENLG